MKLTSNFDENVKMIKSRLKVDKSFDIIERFVEIGGYRFRMYYLDGYVKDSNFEYIRRDMFNIPKEEFEKITSAEMLMKKALSSIEIDVVNDLDKIISEVLAGKVALIGRDYKDALILDLRKYPARSVEEPDREKVLRGAHDGFVETLLSNTALIRRRVRDENLVFEMNSVGKMSKTDVAVGYIETKVNKKALDKVNKYIENLNINALTMGDQSFVEVAKDKTWLNPYPRVRYTERPDVAAAQIIEGDVIVIVDNTPLVLILPSTIFSFFQSVDDYYMPVFTGNYLRFVRTFVLFFNIFLTPVFVLLMQNKQWIGQGLEFIIPKDTPNVPLFLQFLVMEIAVDGLKIASLNTPSSLGASLSIIGGLILGDFAVQTGWVIPQSIFYMAIVALSSFIQPSIEFSYALKFSRIILLLLTGLFDVWGFVIGVLVNILIICSTKSFSGDSYLYPLVPFDWEKLKKLIFRYKKQS